MTENGKIQHMISTARLGAKGGGDRGSSGTATEQLRIEDRENPYVSRLLNCRATSGAMCSLMRYFMLSGTTLGQYIVSHEVQV
jgi:hypothetical protein